MYFRVADVNMIVQHFQGMCACRRELFRIVEEKNDLGLCTMHPKHACADTEMMMCLCVQVMWASIGLSYKGEWAVRIPGATGIQALASVGGEFPVSSVIAHVTRNGRSTVQSQVEGQETIEIRILMSGGGVLTSDQKSF